ncbi:MAG TPA: FliI/YscN family ATPase [Bryobacteraceae bacterium]|nr:FliI/YscN family ATPase [Bryobacteraceae bacterium]
MSSQILSAYFSQLETSSALRWRGRVVQVVGQLVESEGPFCTVGEACEIIDSRGRHWPGQIVGFRGHIVLSMSLRRPTGLRFGDQIVVWGRRPSLRVGEQLLGRVLDGAGSPIDEGSALVCRERYPLDREAPLALERTPIRDALGCGIRAIDAFLTCGRGQRVGILGGSGVGKSTLIGMMARNTSADLTVLGLIGERGREVGELLNTLGEEGRRRSVVVVSTSDQDPLLRIRAGLAATTIAEYFCARGKHVLLVVDSLTRLAMAQREIGLAAGEPPTAKGYTPSVFTLLARLLERAGSFGSGTITGFYTVLMEGDDENDPLVDAVRALLDGHVMLDRRLAAQSHYPPISILDSISRIMPAVISAPHLAKTNHVRRLFATYKASEELIRIGAYQKGSDPELDRAIALMPALREFLMQPSQEVAAMKDSLDRLMALPT